jgi:arabinose-5-phosphate isomerase
LKRVRDLMHGVEEVPLVALTSTLAEAIVQMTRGRFGMTGVADDSGRLVGVVTDGDLRRAFAVSFSDRGVSEVMSRRPHTIGPDELAETALARMNAAAITGLFVLEQERPIGVLHVHDLLRAGVV